MVTQVIAQNVKSNQQTQYHQERLEYLLYSKIETLLNDGLGPYFYHASHSKKLKIRKALHFIKERLFPSWYIYHFFHLPSQVGFKVKPQARILWRNLRGLTLFEIQDACK